jgi:hypothetical protein
MDESETPEERNKKQLGEEKKTLRFREFLVK